VASGYGGRGELIDSIAESGSRLVFIPNSKKLAHPAGFFAAAIEGPCYRTGWLIAAEELWVDTHGSK